MGIVAAYVSEFVLAADPTATVALFVLVGAILVQFPLLQVAGFDLEEFSTKDHLYVAFMTFSLWFVSWTLMLTVQQV
jgi:Zn-dependent protease with chaperone function